MPEEQRPKAYGFLMNSGLGKWISKANTAAFKASGGAMFSAMGDVKLAILTTVGRKSGKEREVPLVYGMDGDNVIFIASKGGHPTHPLWYLNLAADAKVKVQIGKENKDYVARTAAGDERKRCWNIMVAMYKDYDSYQKWTDRVIPVVICEPV